MWDITEYVLCDNSGECGLLNEKDLEIWVSSNLKHSTKAVASVMRVLSMIRRSFVNISYLFFSTRHVRPHLEYCASKWNPSLAIDNDALEKV